MATKNRWAQLLNAIEKKGVLETVVFWLGFWFGREHPGAELGRFFASLAVVGTWGDQPPSGVVGGGPGGAALTFAPGRAAGAVVFSGGSLRDKWLDRAGRVCPSWTRKI
jgi:hypothetical protein